MHALFLEGQAFQVNILRSVVSRVCSDSDIQLGSFRYSAP